MLITKPSQRLFLVYACVFSWGFPQEMLVFLSENASRPFLKVNCISQYYLFQRAKQTEQNSKWDHIKFEIAFFSDRMKIIISFWLIGSEVVRSLLITLAWALDYQVQRKTDFVGRKITGKWLYEDMCTPVVYWSFCREVCSINLTGKKTFSWFCTQNTPLENTDTCLPFKIKKALQ